jgi:hypothetical protein
MPRKPPPEGIQLNLRFDEKLRRQIERAAERNGRSMNAEIVGRLSGSLAIDDSLGGPELRRVSNLMTAAFNHAGQLAAGDKPVSDWINDPNLYLRAAFGAFEALLIGAPETTPDEIIMHVESLKSRLAGRFIREGNTQ